MEFIGDLELQLSEGEGADKKHAGAAMALTNAKKQHKRLAKINEYKELLAQIDEVCMFVCVSVCVCVCVCVCTEGDRCMSVCI
jgi:hypothetical protein